MRQNRREFLERVTTGAMLAAVPFSPDVLRELGALSSSRGRSAEEFDLTWVDRVQGKYRAVFDVPEIDSGYGVWRASIWGKQYMEILKVPPTELTPVLVMRHHGIALAMQQSFWDKYGIGASKKVTHPLTGEVTSKNPALLDEKDGLPEPFSQAGLRKQLDRGVTVLACNLALEDCIDLIAKTEKVSAEEARKRALAFMVPGVILQPSGVFAVTRAQEAGASYVKAS